MTFDPVPAGYHNPWPMAHKGDFFDLPITADPIMIDSWDKKLMVVQYMTSEQYPNPDATDMSGDPSMALVVPAEQYRADYLFHAPTNYDTNWVNIVAPVIADNVVLDGVQITDWTPLGTGGKFKYARPQLDNSGNGDHTITSTSENPDDDVRIGISVYGWGSYTSYWYPGGLDLKPIMVN